MARSPHVPLRGRLGHIPGGGRVKYVFVIITPYLLTGLMAFTSGWYAAHDHMAFSIYAGGSAAVGFILVSNHVAKRILDRFEEEFRESSWRWR